MELKPELIERLRKLEEKYQAMGQDLASYLDGLLHADYLTYWDYIHLDTLLSLQNPRTSFPDEQVFIMYHQITELYFKLILHEIGQIAKEDPLSGKFFLERIERCNRYFGNLVQSFEVMVNGMEKEQFLKYRMSLLPASGFQSAQYRMIEICSTDFRNLVALQHRDDFKNNPNATVEELFEFIYWKTGATELSSGRKTLTLQQFEQKYTQTLIRLAKEYKNTNLLACYKSLSADEQKNPALIAALRELDMNANVNWPLSHYKSAVRYLHKEPLEIAATGGTNWQKYLPPRFQKVIFFRELWNEEELANWGKSWVEDALK